MLKPRTKAALPEELTIRLNRKGSPSNQWINICEQRQFPRQALAHGEPPRFVEVEKRSLEIESET